MNNTEAKETIKALRETALIDDCSGCGKPNALFCPELQDHYCPHCAKVNILSITAENHLIDLIKERVIPYWVAHYKAQGFDSKTCKAILDSFYYSANFEEMNFEDEVLEQTP